MSKNAFFREQTSNSRAKAEIIEKYFMVWASILCGKVNKVSYVDLYAGQGSYDDGKLSTPLLLMDIINKDNNFCNKVQMYFNDMDFDKYNVLNENIVSHECYNKLLYKPIVTCSEVSDSLINAIDKKYPIFLFFDPFGYKGLKLDYLTDLLSGFGSDGMIFFNYVRINAGITNDLVYEHINEIFGTERADKMRIKLELMNKHERLDYILQSFEEALKSIGLQFIVKCEFNKENQDRISHHIFGVSKHMRGYLSMKEIISKATDEKFIKNMRGGAFGSFEFGIKDDIYKLIKSREIIKDTLKKELLKKYNSREISFQKLFDEHHIGTNFYESNYRGILVELEEEGKICVKYSDGTNRSGHSLPLSNNTIIKFL